jgi:hypothetical protein
MQWYVRCVVGWLRRALRQLSSSNDLQRLVDYSSYLETAISALQPAGFRVRWLAPCLQACLQFRVRAGFACWSCCPPLSTRTLKCNPEQVAAAFPTQPCEARRGSRPRDAHSTRVAWTLGRACVVRRCVCWGGRHD